MALLAVAALLIGASSAAALTWSAPVTVSGADSFLAPAQNGGEPEGFGGVAMDAAGDAVAAWMSYADASGNCPCHIRAALRPSGGAFGAPVSLSPDSEAGSGPFDGAAQIGGFPSVAMDAAGDAIVVWAYNTNPSGGLGPDEQVYASVRPAGGQFGAPVQVSSGARGGESPVVAMDSAGDADVMYVSYDSVDQVTRVEVAARPAGGSFQTPQLVTSTADNIPSCCNAGNLAMSAGGRAAIAVDACSAASSCNSGSPSDGTEEVLAATAPAGAAFGPPVAVSPSVAISSTHPFGQPPMEFLSSVASDDQGDTVVLYEDEQSQSSTTAMAATSDAGGAFSPTPATLGTAGSSFPDSVALLADRTAIAEFGTTAGAVDVATRTAGGAFGAPAAMPGTSTATSPAALAAATNLANASGAVLAPLVTLNGAGDASLSVASGAADGSFGPPATVSGSTGGLTDGLGVASAIDRAGDQAVIMWQDGSGPMRVSLGGPQTTTPPPTGGTGSGSGGGSGSNGGSGTNGGSGATGGRRPNTKITGHSVNRRHRTATFRFRAIGAAKGFQCALVPQAKGQHRHSQKPHFGRCRSPKTYQRLARGGRYTFYVRALGAAGPDRSPASVRIRVPRH